MKVQLRVEWHLDVELGFDDVVVLLVPVVVALVGFDRDRRATGFHVELDVVEPLPGGAADGVDHHLGPGAAGDSHVTGEVVQLQRAVGTNGHRAVDGFGFLCAEPRLGRPGRARSGPGQ